MISGQCSSFNDIRGFGFVSVPDIANETCRYFVHHSAIQRRCLVTKKAFPNHKALRAHLKAANLYNCAKSRLHTGEYVRIVPESKESSTAGGSSPRAVKVMPISDGGTLICDHIDMKAPPRYVCRVGRKKLVAATEKVTFAQVVIQREKPPSTIIKDQNWGDIAEDVSEII